jgi:hypothetical protein
VRCDKHLRIWMIEGNWMIIPPTITALSTGVFGTEKGLKNRVTSDQLDEADEIVDQIWMQNLTSKAPDNHTKGSRPNRSTKELPTWRAEGDHQSHKQEQVLASTITSASRSFGT